MAFFNRSKSKSRAASAKRAVPTVVECRHLDAVAEDAVRQWFSGNIKQFSTEGERSVKFAHPDVPGRLLKVKGAGFRGNGIRFGKHLRSDLPAPSFDYEGRMTENHAAGHDNAYLGGATFQQCANEYAVTQRIAALGYDVIPCLGYGRLQHGELCSWFSVFEVSEDWESYAIPNVSVDEYVAAKLRYGQQVRELASQHGLIGHFWYLRGTRRRPYLKDLHPFLSADPINMSRTSWAMHVFYALHICALATIHSVDKWKLGDFPEDIQAYVFRAFHPLATKDEHDKIRFALAAGYMRKSPETFDPDELDALLRSSPITTSLLDAAPPEYARY